MASFDARTQELIRTVVEKYDESSEVRPMSVLQQDIATVVAFAVHTYAGSSSTTQLNGELGQGAEEMQKAVLRLEALSFARRHPRPTDRWTERLHLRMMQPRMRRRMLMIERARERAYASMDTEDRDVWVRERRERHAGVPTQVAVGDAVEEHGVRDYLSVIESPAMNSEKTGLLTAMLRLETRPHVLKVFSERAMWRGQGEEGYFHGAPEDWNCVAAALRTSRAHGLEIHVFPRQSEALSALVAPSAAAMGSTRAMRGLTADARRTMDAGEMLMMEMEMEMDMDMNMDFQEMERREMEIAMRERTRVERTRAGEAVAMRRQVITHSLSATISIATADELVQRINHVQAKYVEYEALVAETQQLAALKDALHDVWPQWSLVDFLERTLVLSVLANQVAALNWNTNNKLCELALLLGHMGQEPAESSVKVEWNVPSLKERFESAGSRTAKTTKTTQTAADSASWPQVGSTRAKSAPGGAAGQEGEGEEKEEEKGSESLAEIFSGVKLALWEKITTEPAISEKARQVLPLVLMQQRLDYAFVLGRANERASWERACVIHENLNRMQTE